jgi:hypothetical protein
MLKRLLIVIIIVATFHSVDQPASAQDSMDFNNWHPITQNNLSEIEAQFTLDIWPSGKPLTFSLDSIYVTQSGEFLFASFSDRAVINRADSAIYIWSINDKTVIQELTNPYAGFVVSPVIASLS